MSTNYWSAGPSYSRKDRSRAGLLASELRYLDWVLLGAVLGLLVLGTLMVWSSTRGFLEVRSQDPQAFLKKQLLNIALGFVLGLVVSRFDYRLLRAYAPFVYVLSLVGLVIVLGLGSAAESKGAQAWIPLPGGFKLQPSEFAKLGLVVSMAMLLGEKRDAESAPRSRDVIQALGLAAVPMVLVLLQNDLGSVLVLGSIMFGMIAMSGASWKWVGGLLAFAVTGATYVVMAGLLDDYQMKRLVSFIDPSADPRASGYNTIQARITIGSGGVFGQGLFNGPQTQGYFVPEQWTDFVYTAAGEELGFVGAATVIVLLGVVLWRAIRIAQLSEDLFGRLVAAGVACWFTFQTFQNIGMCLGIMPVTGLPLPFMSYGGSSMFANLIAIGLLQNVHMGRYT